MKKQATSILKSVKVDSFVKETEKISLENFFNEFKAFEAQDYKKLSGSVKDIISQKIPSHISEEAKDAIELSKEFKRHLDKLYPEGYNLVAIGRSPELIVKALEYQGVPAKYCPISGLGRDISEQHFVDFVSNLEKEKIVEYKKYLDSIGINNFEIEKSKTPFVFVDYTATGNSLDNFKQLLRRKEIGISSANAKFEELNQRQFLTSENKGLVNNFIKNITMGEFKLANLCHYDELNYKDIDKVADIINAPQSDNCKMVHFAILDRLNLSKSRIN